MLFLRMNTTFCQPCGQGKKIVKTENKDSTIYYSLDCGHRFITKEFHEHIGLIEMLTIKGKGLADFSNKHKLKYEGVIGHRIGRDGKLAYVEQVIDRVGNYYKKLVKQEDKIIKDIEGKLTEHR